MSVDPVLMEFQANYEEALAGIQALKDGLANLGKVVAESLGAYQEAKTAVSEYAASLGEAGAAAEEATPAIQENTDALAANAAAATDAGAGGMANFAAGAKKLLGPLTIATAAVIGIGVGAVAMQAHYESAMSVVQALTGQTSQQMQQFNGQVLAMAQDLGAQPEALANGLYFILSAGVKTADAMGVLKVVTEASAAGFVDAQTDADALTTALNSYGAGANQAMQYQDMLLTAVKDGKTTLDQLAGSLGRAAVTGNAANVSFDQVAAALSTMTLDGDSARMASMQLSGLLRAVGINASHVADQAKGMHLSFDLAKFSTMDLHDKLVYLWTITKGNKEELLKLTGGAQGFMAANILMSKGGQTFANIMTDMRKSSGMTASAFKTHEQTMGAVWDHFKATMSVALIQVGQALEPFVKQLLNGLMPQLQKLGAWVASHGQQAAMIFGTIAAILGGALLGAIIAVVAGFIAANAIVIGVVAGIGVLVGGIVWLVSNFHNLVAAGGPLHDIFKALQPTIAKVGDYFGMLGQLWQTQILPALAQLLPVLKIIAIVIGVVLAVAIAMTIGIFLVLIGVISGVIFVIVKIVQAIVSFVQQIPAQWNALVNGVKLAFSMVVSSIKQSWNTVTSIIGGVITWIRTTIGNGFNWVKTHIQQAIQTVVGWFKWLYDHNTYFQRLVDFIHQKIAEIQAKFNEAKAKLTEIWTALWNGVHQKLTDAWNKITGLFDHGKQQATGKVTEMKTGILGIFDNIRSSVVNAVHGLWTKVQGLFNDAKATLGKIVDDLVHNSIVQKILSIGPAMLDAGKHLIQMLINGIKNMAGAVGNEAKNVAGQIGKFLGFHSPTEDGPGATADQWMPNLMSMMASGLDANTGKLQAAAQRAAGAMAGAFNGGGIGVPGAIPSGAPGLGAGGLGSGPAGNSAILSLLQQIASGVNRDPALGSQPVPAGLAAVTQNLGGVNFNGVQDIASVYQKLNMLAGQAIENGQRGATAGLGI